MPSPASFDRANASHCRDDPPWGECGDPKSRDFGAVFAWPAAGGGCKLTYDPKGRRHAVTLFDARRLRGEIVIQGRRFDVVRTATEESFD